ncbi:glycosyltransferase family 4 protein [Aliamphritea ceti]|uniref:glycosyltransferase family 4 protein n=1 Tax=Aliamphritea ceti TaxID=1524258 RepID=UPI0021C3DCC1|nr:glycosyltransferase [Aliamphritea ceti]
MQRIAFYAPLKSPRHKNPSGDRQIARLLLQALALSGFDAELVSQFRSFDKPGNPARQQRMVQLAEKLAQRIINQWHSRGYSPDAWFTYHLYYKAPDLLGPYISKTLNIPYIVCEASWAAKRNNGPWHKYHQQLDLALNTASKVCSINPIDQIALETYYSQRVPSPLHRLAPFVNTLCTEPTHSKLQVSKTYNLDITKPWLITVAMMRDGDKFHSYQLLAETLQQTQADFQLLIIGDGKRRSEVQELFNNNSRVQFGEQLDNKELLDILPHFAINLWPAVNEALGMSFLESQARGCAVIAGDEGGVHSVIRDKETGILCPPRDPSALAKAVEQLLDQPERLQRYQENAKRYVAEQHSLQYASTELHKIITQSITAHTDYSQEF